MLSVNPFNNDRSGSNWLDRQSKRLDRSTRVNDNSRRGGYHTWGSVSDAPHEFDEKPTPNIGDTLDFPNIGENSKDIMIKRRNRGLSRVLGQRTYDSNNDTTSINVKAPLTYVKTWASVAATKISPEQEVKHREDTRISSKKFMMEREYDLMKKQLERDERRRDRQTKEMIASGHDINKVNEYSSDSESE